MFASDGSFLSLRRASTRCLMVSSGQTHSTRLKVALVSDASSRAAMRCRNCMKEASKITDSLLLRRCRASDRIAL